jgi:hypothetical protein
VATLPSLMIIAARVEREKCSSGRSERKVRRDIRTSSIGRRVVVPCLQLLWLVALWSCSAGDECSRAMSKLEDAVKAEVANEERAAGVSADERKELENVPRRLRPDFTAERCRERLRVIPLREQVTVALINGEATRPEFRQNIDCILAASSVHETSDCFLEMMREGKRNEAGSVLHHIEALARLAYAQDGHFPVGTTLDTPPRSNVCPSLRPADWSAPAWQHLSLRIDGELANRYRYESDGQTFKVTAIGDADCDQKEAIYVLNGRVQNGEVKASLEFPPSGVY